MHTPLRVWWMRPLLRLPEKPRAEQQGSLEVMGWLLLLRVVAVVVVFAMSGGERGCVCLWQRCCVRCGSVRNCCCRGLGKLCLG